MTTNEGHDLAIVRNLQAGQVYTVVFQVACEPNWIIVRGNSGVDVPHTTLILDPSYPV
jgi:hypothetical protein